MATSNGNTAGKRGSIWWWIALLVPVAAAIAGGVSPEIYKDLKALVIPGKVFGAYMLLSTNDEDPQKTSVSPITLKSHGYELWGTGKEEPGPGTTSDS